MYKQKPPLSIRPTEKGRVAAERLKKSGKFNRTMSDFLETLVEDSPQIIKIDLDDLKAKRKGRVQEPRGSGRLVQGPDKQTRF